MQITDFSGPFPIAFAGVGSVCTYIHIINLQNHFRAFPNYYFFHLSTKINLDNSFYLQKIFNESPSRI